ncbi:aminopeptidase M1 [Tanacetum coccineum]
MDTVTRLDSRKQTVRIFCAGARTGAGEEVGGASVGETVGAEIGETVGAATGAWAMHEVTKRANNMNNLNSLAETILGVGYEIGYYATTYSLPKLDMIAMPNSAMGAMKNYGLVATIVAHEIALQWFGNLVTMEWWTYMWFNEGSATRIIKDDENDDDVQDR